MGVPNSRQLLAEEVDELEAYYELLKALLCHARGDRHRVELYEPILRLGCVRVDRGKPAAIVAPWHPLRLASLAIKARQVSGLLNHILAGSHVNFVNKQLTTNTKLADGAYRSASHGCGLQGRVSLKWLRSRFGAGEAKCLNIMALNLREHEQPERINFEDRTASASCRRTLHQHGFAKSRGLIQ